MLLRKWILRWISLPCTTWARAGTRQKGAISAYLGMKLCTRCIAHLMTSNPMRKRGFGMPAFSIRNVRLGDLLLKASVCMESMVPKPAIDGLMYRGEAKIWLTTKRRNCCSSGVAGGPWGRRLGRWRGAHALGRCAARRTSTSDSARLSERSFAQQSAVSSAPPHHG